MNEMEHFEHSDRFELWASDIQDGIHAHLACITCHDLENIATNFLHFVSWIPIMWFQFLAGALKNVLSRRFNTFWARVGRVTKQLFCHGLKCEKYFNQKSVGVQPWTPLEAILNEFCLWITPGGVLSGKVGTGMCGPDRVLFRPLRFTNGPFFIWKLV